MKTFLKILLGISILLGLIFLSGYYFKVKRDLVNYNISEKLVVKFEDDDNNYLVNLNDGSYVKYNGKYNNYGYDFILNKNDINSRKEIYNRLIYNQNKEYYFDYRLGIYNQNKERIYRFINSGFFEAYWTFDGKYLITRSGYIARMFGLFIQIETANSVITLVEPKTGKSKQLILGKPGEEFKNIEKILGYVLEN